MDKTDSKPVSEEELEEESEIEEVIEKDGAGYGDLQSLNAQPDDTNRDEETYVGRPAPVKSETYIQERKSYSMGMTDQNKLKNTKLGDHINYYENGVSGNGIVSKMSGQFIQIFKDDGKFYNININDTFHVSDILINKTWDEMDLADRTEQLMKIKAYSPRFLSKTWDQLPRELKDVMKDERSTRYMKEFDENNDSVSGNASGGGRGGNRTRGGSATSDEEISNSHSSHNTDTDGKLGGGGNPRHASGEEEAAPIYRKPKTNDYDPEHNDLELGLEGQHFKKSRISKAEWDLMKDTDHDELTAARASKRQTQDYDDDESITFGGDEHKDTGYKPKGKRKKSSSEDGAFGNTGSSPTTGVSTKIPFDATEDYEGTTHDTRPKQFEYEDEKPEVGNEPKAPEVKLDDQGLIKTGAFVYSDNPQGYKLPPQKTKGSTRYGIRYGVKYINEEEGN